MLRCCDLVCENFLLPFLHIDNVSVLGVISVEGCNVPRLGEAHVGPKMLWRTEKPGRRAGFQHSGCGSVQTALWSKPGLPVPRVTNCLTSRLAQCRGFKAGASYPRPTGTCVPTNRLQMIQEHQDVCISCAFFSFFPLAHVTCIYVCVHTYTRVRVTI